jgi:NADPH2:quinone reductase
MTKAQAIRIDRTGGPEVMELATLDLPPPGPGEVLLRQTAMGVNYQDIYHRSGLYPVPLPSGLGSEAAGIVEAVGAGVTALKPGDHAVYFSRTTGAYATHRIVAAAELTRLPDGVSAEAAAAVWMRGATVEYLVERCARVQAGDHVLVPAAAGGVGLLLCQWLSHIGAVVIGAVGSQAKAEAARAAGAQHLLVGYEGMARRVRDLTGGRGVAAVIDGVGRATFDEALDSLAPRGLMVSFGNASGPVPPIAPLRLLQGGSLFLTRPRVYDYYGTPEEWNHGTGRVLEMLRTGGISAHIGGRYPLAEAARAHADMEERRTQGATLLIA